MDIGVTQTRNVLNHYNEKIFLQAGKLTVKPFTHQTECKLSNRNMCKGKILDDYIASRLEDGEKFSPIVYAGKICLYL